MTRRAVEKAVLLPVVWPMLRAHGIVRAQLTDLDGLPQVPIDPIRGLHKPAERPLSNAGRRCTSGRTSVTRSTPSKA